MNSARADTSQLGVFGRDGDQSGQGTDRNADGNASSGASQALAGTGADAGSVPGGGMSGLMDYHEQLRARAQLLREREQSLDVSFEQSILAALQLRERVISQREVR